MIATLSGILVSLAIVVVLVMVSLFAVKWYQHRRNKGKAFRSAIYISTLGEIVSRSVLPSIDIEKWADDPAFRQTLVDFLRFVDGGERRLLVELAQQLGLIDRFHREVGAKSVKVRLRAVAALSEIASPTSRPHLKRALADSAAEVRVGAAAGLSLIGNTEDVPDVVRALETEGNWGAERIGDSLVRFAAAAVQPLSNQVLLAGPDLMPIPKHLAIIVRSLGLIGDRSAEAALLTALEGEDPLLRIKAAAALAHPWQGRATRALIRRLRDDDWRVRAQAAKALAAHEDPNALGDLRRALRDRAWWVRQDAAEAMAAIPGGIDALFDALGDEDPFAVDAALAQLMAAGELERLEDPAHKKAIEGLHRPHLIEGAG